MSEVNPSARLHELQVKNDFQIAQELKDELRSLLEQQTALMDKARSHSMQLNWSIGMNGFGKSVINEITVVKVL